MTKLKNRALPVSVAMKKAVSLLIAMLILSLALTGCSAEQGDVFRITVDCGNGEDTYTVSYDLYRTIFLYLKNHVSAVVQDSEGKVSLATEDEQNAAIKEVAEDRIIEFYSLVALGKQYGISITEDDRNQFEEDYRKKLQGYVNEIDDETFDFNGTKEEYAQQIYENSLKLAGTTPEYYEFSYYKSLLQQRLKAAIGGDLSDYLNQSYFHYKQVIVVYTKGDADAEEKARLAIDTAREKLEGGADIDDVIAEYGSRDYQSEIYFDSYGNIVGSQSGSTLGTVIVNAIKALDENEISDIMSGDESDRLAYFAIYQRLGFDQEFICSDYAVAEDIYNYSYVDSDYMTPHYTRYITLLESCKQNLAIEPIDAKAYDKLNMRTVK